MPAVHDHVRQDVLRHIAERPPASGIPAPRLLLGVWALGVFFVGCQKGPVPMVRPLAVVVSCDTAGWIVPCGCSSKQAQM